MEAMHWANGVVTAEIYLQAVILRRVYNQLYYIIDNPHHHYEVDYSGRRLLNPLNRYSYQLYSQLNAEWSLNPFRCNLNHELSQLGETLGWLAFLLHIKWMIMYLVKI